jgi:hydrogenase-4 component E
MSETVFAQLLGLGVGLMLVCAYLALWRQSLTAIVRVLAVQGIALGAVAVLLGVHERAAEPLVVGLFVLVLKGWVLPRVLVGVVEAGEETLEAEPLVNVATSLVAGAGLTLLAYSTTSALVALDPATQTRAIPIGVAVALIGFFVLASRRKAVTQIVGFLLVDNGIGLVAFLATSGLPLVVELGVALDVLLAVLILQVLTARMRTKFGATDLNQLRALRD